MLLRIRLVILILCGRRFYVRFLVLRGVVILGGLVYDTVALYGFESLCNRICYRLACYCFGVSKRL